tara:strand:+ start:10 stop:729 length:720 start_codon:yes stop_codon:yes gene_type:complete
MITTKLGKFGKIVIYQYGKVGSSSIGVNLCEWLKCKFPGTTMKIQSRYPKVVHIHDPKILQDIIDNHSSPTNPLLIINATRNFYHRQISEYFQQHKNRENIKTMTMPELGSSLLENKIYRLNDWYQRFEKQLKFDLEPFDYQNHYSLTNSKNKHITVLLVRLEDSKIWPKIFSNLLHPKLTFKKRSNLSKNCWYGDKYNQFKKYFIYPEDAVAKLADSDTHQRYYQDLDKLDIDLPIST